MPGSDRMALEGSGGWEAPPETSSRIRFVKRWFTAFSRTVKSGNISLRIGVPAVHN